MSNSTAETSAATLTLDLTGVQPADIIVSTTDQTTSKAIRIGSCSSYSHAILVLENGDCIESVVKDGVIKRPLSHALENAVRATLLRHHYVDANLAAWICHDAETLGKGKPYDKSGAIRSGVSTGCGGLLRYSTPSLIIQMTDELSKLGNHDDSFFCSELVARAFEKSGLSLINGRAHTATPGAIASSPHLKFIKELITV